MRIDGIILSFTVDKMQKIPESLIPCDFRGFLFAQKVVVFYLTRPGGFAASRP